MTITNKTKFKFLPILSVFFKYSKKNIMEEVKIFDVPKKINGIKVTDIYSLSIGDAIDIWNVGDSDNLLELTKRLFLQNTKKKRLQYRFLVRSDNNLPFIDFSRLLIHTQEVGEFIAKKFNEIVPIVTDERIKEIIAKYSSSADEMILRFCRLYPSYTFKTARELSWYDVFVAFSNDVKNSNIQIEYSQLKPLK